MQKFTSSLFSFILLISCGIAQSPGSGEALDLNGVRSYVNLGDSVANGVRTIEMWFRPNVAISPTNFRTRTLVGRDYNNGDGASTHEFQLYFGEWNPHRGKLSFGRRIGSAVNIINSDRNGWPADVWQHVAVVIDPVLGMRMYINGVLQQQTNTSTAPIGTRTGSRFDDVALGRWGNHNLSMFHRYFNGQIDEVRFWNTARSEDSVRYYMCRKLTGNEPGLKAYYSVDGTVATTLQNRATNRYNGALMGGPVLTTSGAPIGDMSAYDYGVTGNTQVTLVGSNGDRLTIDSLVAQSLAGAHIYYVDDRPSSRVGITGTCGSDSGYFGVFLADDNDTTYRYNFVYTPINAQSGGQVFRRKHNARSTWASTPVIVQNNPTLWKRSGESYRMEYVALYRATPNSIPDTFFCETQGGVTLNATTPNSTYLWQDGSIAPTYFATIPGTYYVTITDNCGTYTDSSDVAFFQPTRANFQVAAITGPPNTFQYTHNSPMAAQFLWDFGDGNTSILPNPTHQYAQGGIYTTCLIVSNECNSDTSCQTVKTFAQSLDPDLLANILVIPDYETQSLILEGSTPQPGIWHCTIYELRGRLVAQQQCRTTSNRFRTRISLPKAVNGMYVLKVDTGERYGIKRFVWRQK